MFVKVFAQILDSSIADDYLVRLVFEDFLKLADKDGAVDMTPSAIARRTHVPLEIVLRGIEKLSQPDPESRSPQEDGRRIVPLDSHRSWGWRIVNYLHYRAIRDQDDRKAYQAEWIRSKRAASRQELSTSVDSRQCRLRSTQAEAEAEADKELSSNAYASVGDSPSQDLFDSASKKEGQMLQDAALRRVWDHYIEKTGRNPRTYEFTAVRKRKGLARLGECLKKTSGDVDKAAELMKVAIDALAASDWHMGRDAKTKGKAYREWDDHLFGSYETMERWWNV